jgi:hypothetical protein
VVVKALTLVLLAGIMVSFIIQLHSVPLIQKLSLGLDLDLDFLCLIKNYLRCLRFSEDDESDTKEEDMEHRSYTIGVISSVNLLIVCIFNFVSSCIQAQAYYEPPLL